MSNNLIRAGFESLIATWAAAQSPAIPVAYENKTFTPPATRYARAFLLPGQTDSQDLQGTHRSYVGVFQVSLYMPVGTGPGAAETLANAICALYPKQTRIVFGGLSIVLTRPMAARAAISDSDRYIVPIDCAYRADTIS